MAFFQFTFDLARTASALETIARELTLLREACERLSPPLPSQPEPYQATLSDLRSTSPQIVGRIQQELSFFADEQNVQLNSEAFYASIQQFEREVASVYGDEAVLELPWNKLAGGSLFATVRKGRQAEEKEPLRAPTSPQPESGARAAAQSASGGMR